MPVAGRDEIVRMLVEVDRLTQLGRQQATGPASLAAWQPVVYGEGGLLVSKVVALWSTYFGPQLEPPGILGVTWVGSPREWDHIDSLGRPSVLNDGETHIRTATPISVYLYRPEAWHQPALPGFFQGETLELEGTGLYWRQAWQFEDEWAALPAATGFLWSGHRRVWGYVPFDEVLGMSAPRPVGSPGSLREAMSRGSLLAQRCYVVGETALEGAPTDSERSRYMSLHRFLQLAGAIEEE